MIGGDRIFAAAGVGLAALGHGLEGKAVKESFDGDGVVRQRRGVIGLTGGSGGEGDGRVVGGDPQCAQDLCQGVVVGVRVAPVDLIGIFRGAHTRDGASGGDCGRFTLRQTGDGGLGTGQEQAVVGLCGGAGADRRGGGGDRQGTVHDGDAQEVRGNVFAFSVHDLIGSNLVRAFADFGLAAAGCGLIGEALGQTIDRDAVVRQRRSVVGFLCRSGGDHDLRRVLGHLQGAQVLLKGIVVGICIAPIEIIGILALTDFGLGTAGDDGDCLTVHQADDAHLIAGQG